MLKKITKLIGTTFLLLFSFYYTDKAVDIVKRNDPIMIKIKEISNNYKIESVNAIIDNNYISSGVNGREVNLDESYKKMKKYNTFYESMLMFNEVVPNTSILNNYDKFVIRGNPVRNEISLLFKITNMNDLDKIYNILLGKNILATFFIDGTVLENNSDNIYEIVKDGYEIENFGYNDIYDKEMFDWTNNLIFSITNRNPLFCYSEINNYDILKLCKKNKMYTVKPIVVNHAPFKTVKHNLNSGNIYSFTVNDEIIKELPVVISFIKQKGYDLVNLEDIIIEDRTLEK